MAEVLTFLSRIAMDLLKGPRYPNAWMNLYLRITNQ